MSTYQGPMIDGDFVRMLLQKAGCNMTIPAGGSWAASINNETAENLAVMLQQLVEGKAIIEPEYGVGFACIGGPKDGQWLAHKGTEYNIADRVIGLDLDPANAQRASDAVITTRRYVLKRYGYTYGWFYE